MSSAVSKKIVFLVPRSLTWDKLCALYLAVAVFVRQRGWSFKELLATGLFDITFDGDDNIPADAIDLDTRKSYKDYGIGSAAEKVVSDHQLDWPGVARLVQLLGVNNATGNLRNDEGSLVLLIRELFNVGAEKPSRQARLDVIERMWPAVEAYFLAAEANEAMVKGMSNPFTLANYERLLQMTQLDSTTRSRKEAMRQTVEVVRNRQITSQARAVNMPLDSFEIPILGTTSMGRGHYVVTDDTRYAGLHFQQQPDSLVLIVRRRSGNGAIFCRGKQNFTVLHQALEGLEPGLWFHENRGGDGRSPMLLNGSTSRNTEPTKLKKAELLALVQKHHKHLPRK